MAASAGSAPLLLLVALFIGVLLLAWKLYSALVGRLPAVPPGFSRLRAGLADVLQLALLVVPLRGGTQQIPVNQSDVYFSTRPFANHASVNVAWNVVNSLVLQSNTPTGYDFLPAATAGQLVGQLYTPQVPLPDSASTGLLRIRRPNVLFIILESFTAKLVGSTGGEKGITPNLDSLARTGVLFTNLYAVGDRSEKGLVGLLSGYPAQPTTSIIKYPSKTEHLPHLCRHLKAAGYHSHYYYGGELAFANMKSYLLSAGYDAFTERADFPLAQQNSKWGAHDHVLFDRMLQDLPRQRRPFFVTAFTLSSHEPYDVPMKARFPGADEENRFRSSVHYTDWALGRFLRQARTQPWWDSTLVVLVADHGHALPGWEQNYQPTKFRVPLLLAGGALRAEVRGREIATIGSQTDVPPTLLAQLGLPATDYRWGHNLLHPRQRPFAFYCYNNGFGLTMTDGTVMFDNVARREIWRTTPQVTDEQVRFGKAYQQASFADFLSR
nr:LTA synthase family protein [Hymenobacter translucens]